MHDRTLITFFNWLFCFHASMQNHLHQHHIVKKRLYSTALVVGFVITEMESELCDWKSIKEGYETTKS